MLYQTRGLPVEYNGSWRDTVVVLLSRTLHLHTPMHVEGVFSSALSRGWACVAYDLDLSLPKFYELNNVPHIDAADTSYVSFLANYEAKNIPVVISNAISGWGALSKWTDEYLSQVCGEKLFRATSAMASHSAAFTMEQYLHYSKRSKDEVPLYLFERDFASHEGLSADFNVPSFFDSTLHPGTDLFRVFGKSRPDHRWLIVGPKKSGSIFHIDPNMTHAWNAVIRGRKKWIFYPPHISPPVRAITVSNICFCDDEEPLVENPYAAVITASACGINPWLTESQPLLLRYLTVTLAASMPHRVTFAIGVVAKVTHHSFRGQPWGVVQPGGSQNDVPLGSVIDPC